MIKTTLVCLWQHFSFLVLLLSLSLNVGVLKFVFSFLVIFIYPCNFKYPLVHIQFTWRIVQTMVGPRAVLRLTHITHVTLFTPLLE